MLQHRTRSRPSLIDLLELGTSVIAILLDSIRTSGSPSADRICGANWSPVLKDLVAYLRLVHNALGSSLASSA